MLDINLPGIDGFETFTQLKRFEETSHTPILALSANVQHDILERCKTYGFTGFLAKPVNIAVMVTSINEALNKSNQK